MNEVDGGGVLFALACVFVALCIMGDCIGGHYRCGKCIEHSQPAECKAVCK